MLRIYLGISDNSKRDSFGYTSGLNLFSFSLFHVYKCEEFPLKGDGMLQARARALGRKVRCIDCDNQSIEDSEAAIAIEMRNFLYEQIKNGKTDDEALSNLLDRYSDVGEMMLFEPKMDSQTIALYATPVLVMLATGFIGYRNLFKRDLVKNNIKNLAMKLIDNSQKTGLSLRERTSMVNLLSGTKK